MVRRQSITDTDGSDEAISISSNEQVEKMPLFVCGFINMLQQIKRWYHVCEFLYFWFLRSIVEIEITTDQKMAKSWNLREECWIQIANDSQNACF